MPRRQIHLVEPDATLDTGVVHKAIDGAAGFQVRHRRADAGFVGDVECGALRGQAFGPQFLDGLLEFLRIPPVEDDRRAVAGQGREPVQSLDRHWNR